MADSYIDVVLPKLQFMLSEVSPTLRTNPILFESPETAAYLAMKQTSQMKSVMVDGRCVAWDVIFQAADQTTIGSGSGTFLPTCTITPTQTFSGLNESYNVLRSFIRTMKIKAQDCNSGIKFEQRMMEASRVKMQEIALELNQYAIAQLIANNQTATHQGDFGTGITGGVIDYPKADLLDSAKFEYRLSDWHNIAQMELLPANFLILNGNSFKNVKNQVGFNAANDDERSQAATMAANNIWWDALGFGASRANIPNTSFLVDPNAFCFLNRSQYPTNPTQIGNATNDRVWSMPLTYLDAVGNVQTMTYMKDGQRVPFMVDVKLQLSCNTADAVDGIPVNDWFLEYRLAADFVIMPTTGTSGIVQILAA
jgi:hypothetical protein